MQHEVEVVDKETGEVVLKNANFIQFYKDNLGLLDKVVLERPAAMRIIFWLVGLMDDQNGVVTSQSAMCQALDMHRNTVTQAIAYLKTKQIIAIFKSGNTNLYALNSQIAWQDDAAGKQFALFKAKVYIIKDEQDIDFQSVKRSVATRRKSGDRTSTKSMRTSEPTNAG